jgi:hypothetical protein
MAQRLKSWESPRRQGRNDKGKGGSARARQLKKQQQMLRKKLKEGQKADEQNPKNPTNRREETQVLFPYFFPSAPQHPRVCFQISCQI